MFTKLPDDFDQWRFLADYREMGVGFDLPESFQEHAPGACLSDRCPETQCVAMRADMKARKYS